jgi:hypothetical protein
LTENDLTPSEESVVTEGDLTPSEDIDVTDSETAGGESELTENDLTPSEESQVTENDLTPSEESAVTENDLTPSDDEDITENDLTPSEESVVSEVSTHDEGTTDDETANSTEKSVDDSTVDDTADTADSEDEDSESEGGCSIIDGVCPEGDMIVTLEDCQDAYLDLLDAGNEYKWMGQTGEPNATPGCFLKNGEEVWWNRVLDAVSKNPDSQSAICRPGGKECPVNRIYKETAEFDCPPQNLITD